MSVGKLNSAFTEVPEYDLNHGADSGEESPLPYSDDEWMLEPMGLGKKKPKETLSQWDIDGKVYTGRYMEVRDGCLMIHILAPGTYHKEVTSFATKDWKEVNYVGEVEQPET